MRDLGMTLEEALNRVSSRRAMIRRRAAELGIPVVDIRMPTCPPADLRGLPRRK